MNSLFKKIFGISPWKKEWQTELSEAVHQAQQGLSVNMVVIIARESDIYSEVLYIFSFIGLSLGSIVAYLLQKQVPNISDLMLFPLGGFSLGATLYTFRRFFIHKIAPRAVRERVTQKAKSQFFDHFQHLKSRVALIYFSELEREALFFSSPDISDEIPRNELQGLLSQLVQEYDAAKPLVSLRPFLDRLGVLLRSRLQGDPAHEATISPRTPAAIYIGASDRPGPRFKIPILKGNKDIN